MNSTHKIKITATMTLLRFNNSTKTPYPNKGENRSQRLNPKDNQKHATYILSLISSSKFMSFLANFCLRNSEATDTAVTCPCQDSPCPSTLPMTAKDVQLTSLKLNKGEQERNGTSRTIFHSALQKDIESPMLTLTVQD